MTEYSTDAAIIIAIDPGETTGWSIMAPKLVISGTNAEPYAVMTASHREDKWRHGQIDCGRARGELNIDEGTASLLGGNNTAGECEGSAELIALCREHPGAAIVVEDFIVDFGQLKKDRVGLSPVRITAKLEQAMWEDSRYIILQDRANAKSTMNDDRLREFGLYERQGGLRHARDADRHAMYFMRRCQVSPKLRHRAWPWLFPEPVVKVRKPRKKTTGDRIVFGD